MTTIVCVSRKVKFHLRQKRPKMSQSRPICLKRISIKSLSPTKELKCSLSRYQDESGVLESTVHYVRRHQ